MRGKYNRLPISVAVIELDETKKPTISVSGTVNRTRNFLINRERAGGG
jgi:hypothetical protein